VPDGDGKRITIVEGRTEDEVWGKLRRMPLPAQRWIMSCGPIIHERRWWTPGVDYTREVGRIPITELPA
jgi:hypothetical protein